MLTVIQYFWDRLDQTWVATSRSGMVTRQLSNSLEHYRQPNNRPKDIDALEAEIRGLQARIKLMVSTGMVRPVAEVKKKVKNGKMRGKVKDTILL